jgi:hypothetical protein
MDGFPFWFPQNFDKYINGSDIKNTSNPEEIANTDVITCVKGIIDPIEYEKLSSRKWFNHEVPKKFKGYNVPNNGFPVKFFLIFFYFIFNFFFFLVLGKFKFDIQFFNDCIWKNDSFRRMQK